MQLYLPRLLLYMSGWRIGDYFINKETLNYSKILYSYNIVPASE